MVKATLKVLVSVFALIFSTGFGLGAECNDDPNECTPKNLCEVATQVVNDSKVWSEDTNAASHVLFVKELGMNCGVTEIKNPCDLDPNECKIKELCEKATIVDDDRKVWSEEAAAHVKLATEYDLKCGVEEVFAFKTSQETKKSDGLKSHSDYSICLTATSNGDWDARAQFQEFVLEAKKRGLDCGVGTLAKTVTSTKFDSWSDHSVCWYVNNKGTKAHKKEAKKRGLDCGVGTLAKTITSTKFDSWSNLTVCWYVNNEGKMAYKEEAKKRELDCGANHASKICKSSAVQNCNDEELCSWASSNGTWQLSSPLQPYVTEAKRRGLGCGIGTVAANITSTKFDSWSDHSVCWYLNNKGTKAHEEEAKKRGLDCGIMKKSASKTVEQKKSSVNTSTHSNNQTSKTSKTTKSNTQKTWAVTSSNSNVQNNITSSVNFLNSGHEFKNAFKSLPALRRKQIQYALRELGFYGSNIDGLWGKGTSRGINNWLKVSGYKTTVHAKVFSEILSGVQVPSSFATATTPRQNIIIDQNAAAKKAANMRQAEFLMNFGFGLMNQGSPRPRSRSTCTVHNSAGSAFYDVDCR